MDQNMSITIFSSVFYSGGSRPSDKGGGGGGVGGGLQKNFFSVIRASFWSKNKGWLGPPGPSPSSSTVLRGKNFFPRITITVLIVFSKRNFMWNLSRFVLAT